MNDLTELVVEARAEGPIVAAAVCPECDALLPPLDTERRHRHIERCRKVTQLLADAEPVRRTIPEKLRRPTLTVRWRTPGGSLREDPPVPFDEQQGYPQFLVATADLPAGTVGEYVVSWPDGRRNIGPTQITVLPDLDDEPDELLDLPAAFRYYARHTDGCGYAQGMGFDLPCTCGYLDALASIDKEHPAKEGP